VPTQLRSVMRQRPGCITHAGVCVRLVARKRRKLSLRDSHQLRETAPYLDEHARDGEFCKSVRCFTPVTREDPPEWRYRSIAAQREIRGAGDSDAEIAHCTRKPLCWTVGAVLMRFNGRVSGYDVGSHARPDWPLASVARRRRMGIVRLPDG